MRQLKQETSQLHARLERDLPLMNRDLTLDQLANILQRFGSFFAGWEPAAGAAVNPHLPGFFASRRKLPLIQRDLAFLGYPIPNQAVQPPAPEWPAVLGAMYVIEGSTLGGQLITRHLEQTLNLRDGNGYSYFMGYGPHTGAKWREFGSMVERFAESAPDHHTSIIDSAKGAFEQLHSILCR